MWGILNRLYLMIHSFFCVNHHPPQVSLSIRQANPFITLLLPSILIMLADMGSCALPLGGGERNAFKVTLVLSFTMFLIILNDQLPGDSKCSPIIRQSPGNTHTNEITIHCQNIWTTWRLESDLFNHLCCRNPLLRLSGALGVEHAGVLAADTSGERWPHFLLLVQTVNGKKHRR